MIFSLVLFCSSSSCFAVVVLTTATGSCDGSADDWAFKLQKLIEFR